ncbi:styrene monooxygenase/indole monooxygenase family protein [Arthrobacter sp. ISL-72]|uniref:styrene monooxygenase/indole monooxygenase family protein n=1 Tax=Arthrobacter sp. ISL-72 TaxID=2819114 RepID=UPI0037C0D348
MIIFVFPALTATGHCEIMVFEGVPGGPTGLPTRAPVHQLGDRPDGGQAAIRCPHADKCSSCGEPRRPDRPVLQPEP